MGSAVINREVSGDLVTTTHYDAALDRLTVERTQDVESYIKRVERSAEYWNSDARRNHEMYYAGSYPQTIVEKYCRDKGITFRDFCIDNSHVRALMQDPEYSVFRVWKGDV